MSSFHKAEAVMTPLLGVEIHSEPIRRHRLATGAALMRESTPEPVEEDDEIIGSCDGTMVRTREGGWRKLKSYRFQHAHGACALSGRRAAAIS